MNKKMIADADCMVRWDQGTSGAVNTEPDMQSENRRKRVVFGLLGTTLDGAGTNPLRVTKPPPGRWEK